MTLPLGRALRGIPRSTMDDPDGQQGEPPSAEGILAEGEQAELRAQVAETTAKPPDFGKTKSHKKTLSQGNVPASATQHGGLTERDLYGLLLDFLMIKGRAPRRNPAVGATLQGDGPQARADQGPSSTAPSALQPQNPNTSTRAQGP